MSPQEFREFKQREAKRKEELRRLEEQERQNYEKAKITEKYREKLGREYAGTIITRKKGENGKTHITSKTRYKPSQKPKRGGKEGLIGFGKFMLGLDGKDERKASKPQPRPDPLGIRGEPPNLLKNNREKK